MVGGRWVNEVLVGGSVVDFGGRLLVVDGSVEDLSVGGWLVVGDRWPTGGLCFCNMVFCANLTNPTTKVRLRRLYLQILNQTYKKHVIFLL